MNDREITAAEAIEIEEEKAHAREQAALDAIKTLNDVIASADINDTRPSVFIEAIRLAHGLLNWAATGPDAGEYFSAIDQSTMLQPEALALTVGGHLPVLGFNATNKVYWLTVAEELKGDVEAWRAVGAFMDKVNSFR